MACIYKIQNKKNGKVYIGQTKRTLEWRLTNSWCGHFMKADTGSRKLYKEGQYCRVLKDEVKQAFEDGWLPLQDYLSNGRTLPWINEGKPVQVHKPKFRLLYKDGKQKRIKPECVEQALIDGWLPYHEYLNNEGDLAWRFTKRGKKNEA